jgi:ATP-dependent protease ClpP protease subunit
MIITKCKNGQLRYQEMPPHQQQHPQEDDGTKIIDGEFHTLFITKEEHRLEEFQTEYNGEVLTAIKESVPEHKKYTLYIEQFGHNKNQLHRIMHELRQADENDILELRIDSPGGYVTEGIMIYNTMREIFNGRTITYLDSAGYSMGAIIFSLGDERVAYDDSSLMYHNYSTGYMGKGGEIKSYIDFEDKHFTEFFINKVVNKGFMTEEEYNRMKDGHDFWLDSMELARRGIATHVIVDGYRLDAEAYIKFKEQSDNIATWASKTISDIEEQAIKEAEAAQAAAEKEEKRMNRIMKKAEKLIAEEDKAKADKVKARRKTTSTK